MATSADDGHSECSYWFRSFGDRGFNRLLLAWLVSFATFRCAALDQDACVRVVVDRVFCTLLWLSSFAIGFVSLVFPVGFSPSSTAPLKRDRSFVAARVCLDGAYAFRSIRCSCGTGWCSANHPWPDAPGRSRVQQYSIQLDVAGDDHDIGSASPALAMAKGIGNWSRSSSVSCQEWLAHLHDCDAWNSSRSRVSNRKATSPGRDRFLRDRPDRHLRFALDTPEGRELAIEIATEPGERRGGRRLNVSLTNLRACLPRLLLVLSSNRQMHPAKICSG